MHTRLPSLLLAVAATASLAGVFLGPTPLVMKVAIAAVIALSAWRPGDGLVVVAAIAPLGGALSALSQAPRSWTVALLFALLAGVAFRESIRPREPRDRAAMIVVAVWVSAVLVSLTLGLFEQRPPTQPPAVFFGSFLAWFLTKFPMFALRDYPGVGAAALVTSGAALFAVTATLCRREPALARRLVGALLLSVAALGALNVNRLIEAALRRPPFLQSLIALHQTLRINTTFTDVNAAGAVFVLMIPVSFALLGVRGLRWLAWSASPCLLAGAWLTGSRTAMAVLPVSIVLLIGLPPRGIRRRSLGLAAALLVGVIGASIVVLLASPRTVAHGSAAVAINVRRDLVTTTMQMVRKRPFFGVGIGRYYDASPRFMPSRLRRQYRNENAHNQYLQVLGELGVVGLVAFLLLLCVALVPALKAFTLVGDPLMGGVAIGCLAFMLTGLSMHPLLTAEVAAAFYVLLGVARAGGTAGWRPSVSESNAAGFAGEKRANLG